MCYLTYRYASTPLIQPENSHLIDDIGAEDGLLHVLLVRLDNTLDGVDHLLDLWGETAAGVLQELGHQDFGVFIRLEVGQGVGSLLGQVCAQCSGFEADDVCWFG